ncbi:MAG: PLP-dependent aspartate aminotransferase family protein [Saprospiraceae bacterium]|nr:PLP-dependent aspartate aminotransferase family protein [Saprospiraceae bacterium]
MDQSYILNHLGEERDQYFGAIAPPVIQSSNFALTSIAHLREAMLAEFDHHLYTRGNNPTVAILRKKIAALEGTEDALITSSGAAAIATAVLGLVQLGDHVVCVQNPYSWTRHLLDQFLPRFGVSATFVDGTDLAVIENAILPNTRVLFLESPNTMTFGLQDLAACAALAKEHQLITCIDNSCSSPLFQKPAAFGIDLVMHSATKYLNGHSDVVAGVICGSRQLIQQIFDRAYMVLGPIISPSDAALIIRGLRTLPLRMERSQQSAAILAERLSLHPAVQQVIHPWRNDFPQSELAKKQMTGTGGLFSILLHTTDPKAIFRFVESLHVFLLAVSWGGHESLIFPVAAVHQLPGKDDPPFPVNLVRLYIGLEDPEFLWADLEQGLSRIQTA